MAISNLAMISSISVKKFFNFVKSFDFYGRLKLTFDGPAPSYFETTKGLALALFVTSSKVLGIGNIAFISACLFIHVEDYIFIFSGYHV